MSRPRSTLLAGAAVVAALVLAAEVARPGPAAPAAAPRAAALAVTEADFVCPTSNGTPTAPTTITVASVGALLHHPPPRTTVTTTQLTGRHAAAQRLPHRVVSRLRSTSAGAAVLVRATGPGAASVAVDQRRLIPGGRSRGLFGTPCARPATDWWMTGADGRVGYADTLILANPGSTTANLTVAAWASTGPLQPPKLQSFTVEPMTAVALPVADYTPDHALVALHVHANSGRVTAALRDVRVSGVRAAGLDWIPPSIAPARSLVVPGIPAGPGQRRLIVTNPTDADATVDLHVVTTSGDFSPAGHPQVVVRAGHSAAIDLSESFSDVPGSVVLTSDRPVVAASVSELTSSVRHGFPEIQWHAAAPPLRGTEVLPDSTPPFQRNVRLYLTAPQSAGRVRLTARDGTSTVVSVRAGRTVAVDPVAELGEVATGPLVLTPLGAAPVWASRSLYALGAHGPLTSAELPTPLPAQVRLPPALPDLRAGLRPAS